MSLILLRRKNMHHFKNLSIVLLPMKNNIFLIINHYSILETIKFEKFKEYILKDLRNY